jgi:hypothetical protein
MKNLFIMMIIFAASKIAYSEEYQAPKIKWNKTSNAPQKVKSETWSPENNYQMSEPSVRDVASEKKDEKIEDANDPFYKDHPYRHPSSQGKMPKTNGSGSAPAHWKVNNR